MSAVKTHSGTVNKLLEEAFIDTIQFNLVCPLVINYYWWPFICLTCKTSKYTNPITTKIL